MESITSASSSSVELESSRSQSRQLNTIPAQESDNLNCEASTSGSSEYESIGGTYQLTASFANLTTQDEPFTEKNIVNCEASNSGSSFQRTERWFNMEHQHYESEIRSAGHGEKFQTDVALSLMLVMRKCSSAVRMAYEMKLGDKFDDVVWIDDTNKEIHLIQAKHADTSDGKIKYIDLDALFPTGKSGKRNGDFDLCKYAKSYLSVIQSLEPTYKKKFYIFTNKDLKQTDNDWVQIKEREANEILHLPGSSARNLKLIPTEKAINEMSNNLNKDFIEIKDAIKKLFYCGKIDPIFSYYCTPLKDVLNINHKKCRFASKFNSEHKNPNVAILYTMLQRDQVNMEREVPVNNNFLTKESRNKMLPPYVTEDDIVGFFRNFTLSVDQPDDLRPIIISELQAWMKTWIRPDILGQLRENDFEQLYINLGKYFVKFNEPVVSNRKRFLEKPDVEHCYDELRREWQTGVLKHIIVEAEEWEKTYINRHIKYEEATLESTEGMDDTVTDRNSNNTIVRQISDTSFVKELRGTFQNHQHILLVADPGMGKTSLLQFLAFEVQKQPDVVGFLVYFSALNKELNKVENVSNLNDVRGILSAVLSKDNCDLILNAPEEQLNKKYSIILALDAFDEMHSKYTDKVTSILELLSRKKSIQFIISSRTHTQKLLESKFDVKLIFLVPFSEEDQIRYLKKMWMKENIHEKSVENFSKHLFKKIHSSIPSNMSEISGLPLMMRMLAEIYSDPFERFISAKDTGSKEQFDFSDDKLNISKLFERFIKKCFHNKFVEKFKATVDINDAEFELIIEGYILEHQLLAIKQLDIENLTDLFSNPYCTRKYNLFKSRCAMDSDKSVLVKVVNNDVQFCHLSFGEYFVATYLSDHIYTLQPELLIKVLSQHEVIRKLTLIKLGEDETYSKILKDFCRLDLKIPLWACESGSLKLVSSLKVNFGSFSIDQLNAMLQISAKCGYHEICDFLIAYNSSLDKSTALLSAVEHGHVKVVQLMLKFNVDVNCRKDNGRTPLHVAADHGHASVLNLLIKNKADPTEVDKNEWTLLHFACRNGNVETVQNLIDQGLNTSSRSTSGQTPLHTAAFHGHVSIVQLLIENNADQNEVDERKWTALHFACQNGNAEMVKFLIDQGLKTSSMSTSRKTPLHIAVLNGHASVVKLLMENITDPTEVKKIDWNVLHFACRNGNAETVKFLIDKGMETSSRSTSGQTPLHTAAFNGHASVVKLLIENKADPTELNKNEWTALHFACENGNVETVKFLIDQGLKTSSRSTTGQTPLHIAASNGNASVVKLLIQYKADPTEMDEDEWTALHFASQNGNAETVKFLIALHVNTSSQTIDGRTPFDIARSKGHADITKLLLDNGGN